MRKRKPTAGDTPGLEKKILEELIYERVRVSLDLCALLELEADLAASIERALRQCAASPDERSDLAMQYLTTAWERLGEEVMSELAARELDDMEQQHAPD